MDTRRLLILDDDPMVGRVLGLSARKFGFEFEHLLDPHTFVARMAEWAPSHVAIDLSLPGMNGTAVLDQLAKAGCAARVIIFSGGGAAETAAALEHARASGLNVGGVLAKPFKAAALKDLLSAHEPDQADSVDSPAAS